MDKKEIKLRRHSYFFTLKILEAWPWWKKMLFCVEYIFLKRHCKSEMAACDRILENWQDRWSNIYIHHDATINKQKISEVIDD